MPNPFFNSKGYSGQTHRPDNLKITKSSLTFGPLEVSRGPTVPSMDYGRPGDIILIDSTDAPSTIIQSDQIPVSVGLWIKMPLSSSVVPAGNSVTGYPMVVAHAGDTLSISGTQVVLTAPYTPLQVVSDINLAGIPNITARAIYDSVMITESTGAEIVITDVAGNATVTLGLYSQHSIAESIRVGQPSNGVWMPVGYVAGSGGSGGNAAATYLTLVGDATLPNARTLNGGNGVVLVDNGSGNTLDIVHDIAGVTAISEPLSGSDELLVHNVSTGGVEKSIISDIVALANGAGIQQNNLIIGTAGSYNIGSALPTNALVRRISLEITSPYSGGTLIDIGDAGVADRLLRSVDNDPSATGVYETVATQVYGAPTQIIATITGGPIAGSGRVIIDFIVL